MGRTRLSTLSLLASVAVGTFAQKASAGPLIDDLSARYSMMRITEVKLGDSIRTPVFDRHNLSLDLGIRQWTIGLQYQRTSKQASTEAGTPEHGLMLTAGYSDTINSWLLFEGFARIALTPNTDESQPLYGTDTDLRLKLVAFDSDGWGGPEHPICPSFYAGTIVNRFGRTQLIAGLGLWWRGVSGYVTGLYSLNGVKDPTVTPDPNMFANLQNAFITLSAGYDLEINDTARVHFELRRNIALRNSGNDTLGMIEFRYAFSSPELEFL